MPMCVKHKYMYKYIYKATFDARMLTYRSLLLPSPSCSSVMSNFHALISLPRIVGGSLKGESKLTRFKSKKLHSGGKQPSFCMRIAQEKENYFRIFQFQK